MSEPKVLRVEPGGFRVLGGIRFHRHDGGLGFLLDLHGIRISVSFRHDGFRKYFRHSRYYFRVLRFKPEPGFSRAWVFVGPAWVTIGPAYSGYLVTSYPFLPKDTARTRESLESENEQHTR